MADNEKKIDIRELRKKRLNFRIHNFKKQWKIFYRSGYGKVGFYIILIFAVIALLSPLLEVHQDAISYIAPSIDTTAPYQLTFATIKEPAMLNRSLIMPAASAISDLGSNMVYSITENGSVMATSLGSAHSIPANSVINLFNVTVSPGSRVLGIDVFPLESVTSSGLLIVNNYVLVATSAGNITLARLTWTGGPAGSGKLVVSSKDTLDLGLALKTMPVSSSLPIETSAIPNLPYSSEIYSGPDGNYGTVFAIGYNSTGTYLVRIADSSLMPLYYKKLPLSSGTMSLSVIGGYYQTSVNKVQYIVLTNGDSIYSYYAYNGTEAWSRTMSPYSFSGLSTVPEAYQISYNPYNSIFEVMNSSSGDFVYGFYQANGTPYKVFSTSEKITAISASNGGSGFPSTLIAIAGNEAYVLSSPNHIAGNVTLDSSHGLYSGNPQYVPSFNSYIISSSGGSIYSLSASLGKNPFNWVYTYPAGHSNISNAMLLLDANSGKEAISFVSSAGSIAVYSADGVTLNPMPPELHTPSGTTLLLGTNTDGNDVWSQFIASFTPDWIVGISVGVIGIAIALVLGMIIGYYRGFVSVALDTVTLVIYLIPGLALLIALTSVISPSFFNIIWILSFLSWPFTTFTILGIIRSIKQRAFVEAAKVSGAGTLQILRRHMLPNITPLLIYLAALSVSGAVGGIATLQFIGVAPLTILTWGAMLNPLYNNFYLAASAPWWVIPPTVALTLFIMAFIFLSRGVDEVVNPRIRRR